MKLVPRPRHHSPGVHTDERGAIRPTPLPQPLGRGVGQLSPKEIQQGGGGGAGARGDQELRRQGTECEEGSVKEEVKEEGRKGSKFGADSKTEGYENER